MNIIYVNRRKIEVEGSNISVISTDNVTRIFSDGKEVIPADTSTNDHMLRMVARLVRDLFRF